MSATPTHLALYRRWRSQRFAEVVGQEAVVATLRNALRTGRTAHAYLFVGPRGTGKTSLARIVAKAINCPNVADGEPCDTCPSCAAIREGRALDVVELDAASNNRVDDIRELLPRIYTGPADLPTKVFIVDEVQRITQGWDVLLKTLEEPPPNVLFIFCTTDSSQIRPAVLSRVQRFDFRPLAIPLIEGKLRRILEADGRAAEPAAIALVARLADGGMRDAESILDQLLSAGEPMLTADGVRDLLGLADADSIATFVTALARADVPAGLAVLDGLEDRGRDLGSFVDQVVDALRAALRSALGAGPRDDPLAALGAASLAAVGRRVAALDPASPAPGGIRFQLELTLLGVAPVGAAPPPGAVPLADAGRPAPAPSGPLHAEPAVPVAIEPGPDPAPAVQARGRAERTAAAPVRASNQPAVAQVDPAAAATPTSPDPAAGAPTPGEPPGDAASALVDLRRRWPEVVALISRHPPTKPLIEACRPVAVDGNVVTLGFPESQLFLRDVADRRRPTLEDGLGRILGRAVSVRCVATNIDLDPAAAEDSEAAAVLAAARNVWGDDLVDVPEIR